MSKPLTSYDDLPEPGTVMTAADYLRTPESNRVHELWRGVFRVAESPTSWHQDLAFEIAVAIRAHAKLRGLGKVWVAPLDVILDQDRAIVLQPDVVYTIGRPGTCVRLSEVRGSLPRGRRATLCYSPHRSFWSSAPPISSLRFFPTSDTSSG